MNKEISIIMPAHNEAKSIVVCLDSLKKELASLDLEKYEIIVVNDGSTDETKNVLLSQDGIKLINHPYNKGYGAALKTGVNNAQYEWLLFMDADGQHKPEYIKSFLKNFGEYDLVAGDRTNGKYIRPTLRKPGLWLLRKIANYLVDYKIPDLNCGMRLIRKKILINYLHLMPNGFSMSTTSTLAFLKDRKNVKFLPTEVEKREYHSKDSTRVKPRDAITTLMLIFRLIMLFSPLRIFFPVSLVLFLAGVVLLVWDLILLNISEGTIFILIASMLIFFFGLIADQLASLRREIGLGKNS